MTSFFDRIAKSTVNPSIGTCRRTATPRFLNCRRASQAFRSGKFASRRRHRARVIAWRVIGQIYKLDRKMIRSERLNPHTGASPSPGCGRGVGVRARWDTSKQCLCGPRERCPHPRPFSGQSYTIAFPSKPASGRRGRKGWIHAPKSDRFQLLVPFCPSPLDEGLVRNGWIKGGSGGRVAGLGELYPLHGNAPGFEAGRASDHLIQWIK